MLSNARRRIVLLLALVALLLALAALWLATTAWSCSTVLSGVLGRRAATPEPAVSHVVQVVATATPTPSATPTAGHTPTPTATAAATFTATRTVTPSASPSARASATAAATATGAPTAMATVATTSVPTLAPTSTPTAAPTRAPAAAPTAEPTVVQAPPPTADPGVTVEVSEAELNAEFAARIGSFEKEGARITDGSVGVTESDLVLNVTIVHDPTGLRVGATIRGVPGVSGGQATFQITSVSVHQGVPALLRGTAEKVMREAMQDYLAANGIPLPAHDMYLERIELRPGVVMLHGRRR